MKIFKKNNDRYQHVLPYYDFSTSLFSNKRGKLSFRTNGRNTLQNTNNLKAQLPIQWNINQMIG